MTKPGTIHAKCQGVLARHFIMLALAPAGTVGHATGQRCGHHQPTMAPSRGLPQPTRRAVATRPGRLLLAVQLPIVAAQRSRQSPRGLPPLRQLRLLGLAQRRRHGGGQPRQIQVAGDQQQRHHLRLAVRRRRVSSVVHPLQCQARAGAAPHHQRVLQQPRPGPPRHLASAQAQHARPQPPQRAAALRLPRPHRRPRRLRRPTGPRRGWARRARQPHRHRPRQEQGGRS
mmetsp:Transcript_106203/g.274661  ORF Transcript_106203/g.274661 Transcript_106203/m.274661 type:complete len:229 (+) Transcript_106203:649-1335(+)